MLQVQEQPPQEAGGGPRRLKPLAAFEGSLANRVFLSLKEAILSMSYGPGEILRKGEICATLGVSRSPVAEAMARLAMEGLVDVVPQAGTYVARFSMAEIRGGAFLREAIELAAAERVAGIVTDAQIAELRGNLDAQAAMIARGDLKGFYRLDGEMHALILSFTGHPKLAQVAQTAWLHVNRARQLILPVPGRIEATLEEHHTIVAALAARDPERARAATRAHLGQLLAYLEPLERERPDLFDPG